MNVRARFAVTMKYCAFVAAAWLLSVTCTAASPITIGTFSIQNDTTDPFFAGPTFVVTNDSALAGLEAVFGDIHLIFDLQNLSSLDFSLASFLGSGGAVDSNGLADALGQSLLPDLGTVLDAYLTFNAIPAPLTIFCGVHKLEPGHLLEWRPGTAPIVRRWCRPAPVAAADVRRQPFDALATELRSRLRDSVRAHLVADVPVGVFLSGGVDSGALAALAAQESSERVSTFSIGFEEQSFD
jgi:hypothetical protein